MNKNLKNFIFYSLASILGAGLSIILLPIFTQYLSPKELGSFSLFISISKVVGVFLLFGTNGYLSSHFFKKKETDFSKGNFPIWAIIQISIALFSIVIFYEIFIGLGDLFEIVTLSLFYSFFQAICLFGFTFLQLNREGMKFSILSTIIVFFNLIVGALIIVYVSPIWQSRAIPLLLATTLVSFFFLYKFKLKNIKEIFRFKNKSRIYLFGIGVLPHTFGSMIISNADKIYLAKDFSVSELGLYYVGFQIASIFILFEEAIHKSISPIVLNLMNQSFDLNQGVKKLGRYLGIYIGFSVVGVISIFVAIPILFEYFIDSNYSKAETYVFWLLIGFVFSFLYKFFSTTFYHYNKPKYLSGITVTSMLIYFLILPVFGDYFGVIGFCYAFALINLFQLCVVLLFSSIFVLKLGFGDNLSKMN